MTRTKLQIPPEQASDLVRLRSRIEAIRYAMAKLNTSMMFLEADISHASGPRRDQLADQWANARTSYEQNGEKWDKLYWQAYFIIEDLIGQRPV